MNPEVAGGAAQRERGQQRDVVGEHGVVGRGEDRPHEQRLADQVLGVGEGVVVRMKDRRVPEAAVTRAGQPLRVPAEDDRIEKRIAEIWLAARW